LPARSPLRAAGAILAGALLVTGCGTPGPGPLPDPTRAAPVSTVDAADRQAAERAALDAYAGYLRASREANRAGDPLHPALTDYLADPLLTQVRLAIRDAHDHGARRTGTLTSDPTVTLVSLEGSPPTVEIQDCLDATGYRLTYVDGDRAVPGSAGQRYLVTATATRYHDRWLINTGAAHRDQPC